MSSVTSALYDEIYERGNWRAESKLDVYPPNSDTLFYSFGEDRLIEMKTTRGLMPNGELSVGNVIVGEINVQLYPTDENGTILEIPKNATLKPYFRLVDNGTGEISEWIQKSVFNIENRTYDSMTGKMDIVGYDPMRKLEVDMPWVSTTNTAEYLLTYIVDIANIALDERSFLTVDRNFTLNLIPQNPESLVDNQKISARHVLGVLCGVHFANAFITNDGELLVSPIGVGFIEGEGNSSSSQVSNQSAQKIHEKEIQKITGITAKFDSFGGSESNFWGTSEGVVLSVSCPESLLYSQHFPNLLDDYLMWRNYSYSAEKMLIDPAADLGDYFVISTPVRMPPVRRTIFRQTVYFGPLMQSDVESPTNYISEFETMAQWQTGSASSYQTQTDRDLAARPTVDMVDNIVCGACELIDEYADLDDYTNPGIYAVPTNAIASTVANCPSTRGGRLTVISSLGRRYTDSSTNIYLRQIYAAFNGVIYQRYADSNSGWGNLSWKSWNIIATQNWVESLLFDAGTELAGTETLTDLGTGKYEANSNDIAVALQNVSSGNCPTSKNFSLLVYNRVSTPRKGLIITDSQGDVYIKQQSTASGWTSWMKLTSTAV